MKAHKKILVPAAAALGATATAYLLLWPVCIDPAPWSPPASPGFTGAFAPNTYLAGIARIGEGAWKGPENVAMDGRGRIYGGMEDGRIMRFRPDGGRPEVFARTGGRPLGMAFDARGNLIVADAYQGLLSIDPGGHAVVLSTQADGIRINFANDVDIADDGRIYFSDASTKFSLHDTIADLLEHGGHGRLLVYDPATQTTSTLLNNLQYANGVAVCPDQDAVLVVETGNYCIRRYWIAGPQKGASERFVENFPGYPDGVSFNGVDTYWVAMAAPRHPKLEGLLRAPLMRRLVMRLPACVRPAAKRYGFIIGLDLDGRVMHNLQDPAGGFAEIASVEEYRGVLYIGNLAENAIGRIRVPPVRDRPAP